MAVPANISKAAPPPRPNRMTLASITKGKIMAPYRVLVYGVDKIGKSKFGSDAPNPVFLGPEEGTNQLDVWRFPVPESFEDMRDAIRVLTENRGEYQTLVIDSIDWVEPMIWSHVCKVAGVDSIESVGGGYGKGYTAALDQWRVLLSDLERLQRVQKMHLVLIAHAFVKTFKNPEGEDFDRYTLKMHDKAAALVREWCEGVYFAQYETFTNKEKGKRVKGVSTGARFLYTQRTAAYDAGDRYGLPEQVSLSWDEFDAAAKAGRPSDPQALDSEIRRKAALLGGEVEKVATAWAEKYAGNAAELARMNDRLNAKLAEKSETEGA
jgi:hypothetical protein